MAGGQREPWVPLLKTPTPQEEMPHWPDAFFAAQRGYGSGAGHVELAVMWSKSWRNVGRFPSSRGTAPVPHLTKHFFQTQRLLTHIPCVIVTAA